jgi:hypothetical protein
MCRLFERIQYNYIWLVIMVSYTTCFNRGLENLKSVCDRSISWPPDAMRTMCRSTWRFVAPRGLTALQVLVETMRRPWHGDAIRTHKMYVPDMCLTCAWQCLGLWCLMMPYCWADNDGMWHVDATRGHRIFPYLLATAQDAFLPSKYHRAEISFRIDQDCRFKRPHWNDA